MSRCQEITKLGKQCRNKSKNGNCYAHSEHKCGKCNVNSNFKLNVKLSTCGHNLCNDCKINFMIRTYSYEFNTNDEICCPICSIVLNDADWSNISDYLVTKNVFIRTKHYVKMIPYDKLNEILTYKKNINNINNIVNAYIILHECGIKSFTDSDVSVVYFTRIGYNFIQKYRTNYSFKINYEELKEKCEPLKKELIEYLYHPSRMSFEL